MEKTVVEIALSLTDSEAEQMLVFLRYLTRRQTLINVRGEEEANHVQSGFDKLRQSLVQAGCRYR